MLGKKMDNTKECPKCCEIINSKAKKCPHCLSAQSFWQSPYLFIIIIFVAMIPIQLLTIGSISGENFENYKEKVQISSSKIVHYTNDCGERVAVVGTIDNSTDKKWDNVHFEAKFFNKTGELIDSISKENYDLLLLPQSSSTFKITGSATNDPSLYDHYEVAIKSASEFTR